VETRDSDEKIATLFPILGTGKLCYILKKPVLKYIKANALTPMPVYHRRH